MGGVGSSIFVALNVFNLLEVPQLSVSVILLCNTIDHIHIKTVILSQNDIKWTMVCCSKSFSIRKMSCICT